MLTRDQSDRNSVKIGNPSLWVQIIKTLNTGIQTQNKQRTANDNVCGSILQLICASISVLASFYLLHRADEPPKERNSCPQLQPYFIGFCRVGVSQTQLFYVVSALQFYRYSAGILVAGSIFVEMLVPEVTGTPGETPI